MPSASPAGTAPSRPGCFQIPRRRREGAFGSRRRRRPTRSRTGWTARGRRQPRREMDPQHAGRAPQRSQRALPGQQISAGKPTAGSTREKRTTRRRTLPPEQSNRPQPTENPGSDQPWVAAGVAGPASLPACVWWRRRPPARELPSRFWGAALPESPESCGYTARGNLWIRWPTGGL